MAFWSKKKTTPAPQSKTHISKEPGRSFDTALTASGPNDSQRMAEDVRCHTCGIRGGHKNIGGSNWARTPRNGEPEGFRVQVVECRGCGHLNPVVFHAYDNTLETMLQAAKSASGEERQKIMALFGEPGGRPQMLIARGPTPQEYMHYLFDLGEHTVHSPKFRIEKSVFHCKTCPDVGKIGLFQVVTIMEQGQLKCGACGEIVYHTESGNRLASLTGDATKKLKDLAEQQSGGEHSQPFRCGNLHCKHCSGEKFRVHYPTPESGFITCDSCQNVVFLENEGEYFQVWRMNSELKPVWFEIARNNPA